MKSTLKSVLLAKAPLILRVLLSFIGTYGVCYLGTCMGIARSSYSVLALAAFAGIWLLLNWCTQNLAAFSDRRTKLRCGVFAAIVSFLFSLSMIMGYQLQNSGITDSGFTGKLFIVLRSACLSIAVFPFSSFLFQYAGSQKLPKQDVSKPWRPSIVFAFSAFIIFLCLIPVWLAFYPIIMSFDFHRQINEAYNGFAYFYPYQPIAHTWVIWVFLQIGTALGSLEAGFGFMALFQILLYSLVNGYACSTLYRILPRKWAVVAAVLFFGVFPFNSVLAVCTTKDVLFTILFMLFFLLLLERFYLCKEEGSFANTPLLSKRNILDFLLVAEGCLMMQFRNNAFYAVSVFMILFVIFAARKERLRILFLCVLLIVGGKLTGIAVKSAIGTELNSAKVEMFSVPIQQFARVGYYHGSSLDQFTALELDSYVPWQDWEHYNPPLADTVKNSVRSENFEGDYGRLLSLWVKLGLQYPNEYVDAFLELTRGYWFLDDRSWAENLGYGAESRMGAIFTYNSSEIAGVGSIAHESKLPWLENILVNIVNANAFYDWPLISIIFRSAFYPWCLFLITMLYLYKRQYQCFKLSLLIWMYFGTVLLGPVVQIRYVFPLMVLVPILAAMLFRKEETDEVKTL